MKIRSITAPNPGPFTLDGTRTYLLGETAVIDPGPRIESHVTAILAAMPKLSMILLTHRHGDHAPAALPLREATGARIVAPYGVFDGSDVAIRVSGGETFEIEGERVEVVATPGHTGEHVCYLTSSGDLFTGDTILGSGTTAVFPPDGSMGDYIRSLRRLRDKQPKRIHPGHGPTRDDAIALIDEYLAHRLGRERQIVEAIERGATTIESIRSIVYPALDPRLERAASAQIAAHLIQLDEEGRLPAGVERPR
ncbi:MAG TPA: MBL fold metallo-hydrolase [Thermoanaerobaculia bacterium]|nr:MBL fold metallo-hydrolase [Thermoanaerobaculia bacterium]